MLSEPHPSGRQGSRVPSLGYTAPSVSSLQPTPHPRPVPCTLLGTSQTRASRMLCQLTLPSLWLCAQPSAHLTQLDGDTVSPAGLPLPSSGA